MIDHAKLLVGAVGFHTGKKEKLSSSKAGQPAWLLLSSSPFSVLNPATPLCSVVRELSVVLAPS